MRALPDLVFEHWEPHPSHSGTNAPISGPIYGQKGTNGSLSGSICGQKGTNGQILIGSSRKTHHSRFPIASATPSSQSVVPPPCGERRLACCGDSCGAASSG
jgi:hypothetical protein